MISIVSDVLLIVVMPLALTIVAGAVFQSRVPQARDVLGRLFTNLILPCFMAYFIATARLDGVVAGRVLVFTIVQSLVIGLTGWLVAYGLRLTQEMRLLVAVSASFSNSGNFGIPLAQLAFPPEIAAYQVLIAAVTPVLFAPALACLSRPVESIGRSASRIVASPMVLGCLAGMAVRVLGLDLPGVVAVPMEWFAKAYPAMALLTLGVSLRLDAAWGGGKSIGAAVGMKLALAPCVTWVLASAFGFSGPLHELLVVTAAQPVAALVPIFAARNADKPELAAAAALVVLGTSAAAPLVVAAWMIVSRTAGGGL
jgi:predicted permease